MNIATDKVDQNRLTELFTKKQSLRNLAFDFCTAFNVKVDKVKSNDALRLVTPNGLDAGELTTGSNSRDRSEAIYIYENQYLIKKEKASSNSSRSERDSNKIATLIRTLKKNNEGPSDVAMTKAYAEEAITALHPVKDNARYGAPKLDLNKDITKMLAEFYLGVDTNSIRQYSSELKDSYSKYLVDMEKFNESADDHKRFCKGFKLIGIHYEHYYNSDDGKSPPRYIVGEGEVVNADSREKVLVQGSLKSYLSLKDVPEIAVDAIMIATYMQGRSTDRSYSDRNELFIGRIDKFLPDLDIGVGYRNNIVWVAIPKTPKQ
jgi:hypothetical protein